MLAVIAAFAFFAPAVTVSARGALEPGAPGQIVVVNIDRTLDPITATFARRQIESGSRDDATAVVVALDSADASLTATDTLVESIVNAGVPVIVYAPPGAEQMTPAALIVAMAAPLFALSPDTQIGMDPVSLKSVRGAGSRESGAERESVSEAVDTVRSLAQSHGRNADLAAEVISLDTNVDAADAVGRRLADLVAPDLKTLLKAVDGRQIEFDARTVTLHTAGHPIRDLHLSPFARLLSRLLTPNAAYILFMIGVFGILVEISMPGIGAPGIVGAIFVLLALLGFGALPVSIIGIALALLGVVLFVVEVKVPTHGLLTAGGLAALLIGSFLLFPPWETSPLPGISAPRVSPAIIVLTSVAVGGGLALIAYKGATAQKLAVSAGKEVMVGLDGDAITDLKPKGVVRVANEEWTALSAGEDIAAGEMITVVGVEGVHLVVIRRL